MNSNLLMVFVKNPELGKVKTRLAKTLGNEKALQVYLNLMDYTLSLCSSLKSDKAVFYSNNLIENDVLAKENFIQKVQQGDELGERMLHAFEFAFAQGYTKVLIIGSDCLDLSQDILNKAFEELNSHDVVIGPALDGGYYLLGMNQLYTKLFTNKVWSTENVLNDTLKDASALNLSCKLLPALSDIDEEKDLEPHLDWLKSKGVDISSKIL
jgi:uncharacterized protein